MGSKNRKTGIECIGDVPWGTHICQFYQSKEDLAEVVVPYFKAGLENNEFCLWITSETTGERDAQKVLKKAVPGLDRFLRLGQVEIAAQTEWTGKGGPLSPQAVVDSWVDRLAQALAKGYDGMRLAADKAWLEKADWRAFASFEAQLDESIHKYPMIALCTYSLDKCDKYRASDIVGVIKAHQFSISKRDGRWESVGGVERDQDRRELWEVEERLRALFESSTDGIVFVDVEGNITGLNRSAVTLYGCEDEEELVGQNLFDLVAREDHVKVTDRIRATFEAERSGGIECTLLTRSGKRFSAEVSASLLCDRSAKPTGFAIVVKNLTERRQTEEALQALDRHYHLLAENMTDVVWTMDMDLQPTYLSPSVTRLLGYDVDEAMTRMITEALTPASREMAMTAIARVLSTENLGGKDLFKSQNLELEMEMRRKDGSTLWTNTSMSFECDRDDGRPAEIKGIVRDITERKRAEELFMILSSNSPVGIYIVRGGRFQFVNPRVLKFTGYAEDELVGTDCLRLVVPEDREAVRENAVKMLRNERFSPYEYRYVTKDGKTRWAMEKVASVQYRGETAILGNFMDVTERKQADEALRESEKRYRLLAENVKDVIWTMDLNLKPTYLSPSIMRLLGYSVEEAMEQMMEGILAPRSREVVMKAIARALAGEEKELVRLRNLGLEMEMRRKDGSTVWTDTTVSFICDSHGQPVEIMGVVRDITERKHADEKLQQSFRKLERAMESTIRAITLTVETRDRYTVGHQRRVTELACAIAKEMSLSNDQVDAIRVSGLLHDIGKIYIPTEILSKPGQLNDVEYAMIKTHPQVGYDILKTIEFPWPVAKIVLQHHERLDGSGYRSGLQGEEILLEARILSVADVVEAMSSHRPYRMALGLDEALAEVSRNRGVLYDPPVVDACSGLFSEKGFVFNSAN
jgi:PAS domain S-box-containing protein/putative nucleotidyltransferase with HDIG domain